MLWDIMQAYIPSKIERNCIVIRHLSAKLKKIYLKDTVLYVVKPLYGWAGAGNHWFATYLVHHKEKLGIKMTPYDTCFLISKDGGENFDIVRILIDNTLNVEIEVFIKKEETKIMKAKFKAKTQTILEIGESGDFNSCWMTIKGEYIMVV